MGRGALVILVVLLFIAGIGAVGYAVFSSITILPKITNTTSNMNQFGSSMVQIKKVYFHIGLNDSACTEAHRLVILEIEYIPNRIPQTCQVSVNNKLEKNIEMYEFECLECKEVQSIIDLSAQKVNQEHTIEVCCQEACTHMKLEPLCAMVQPEQT